MIANTAFRLEATVSGPRSWWNGRTRFFGAIGRGFTVPVRDNGRTNDLRQACGPAGLELFGTSDPRHGVHRSPARSPTGNGVVLRDRARRGRRARRSRR